MEYRSSKKLSFKNDSMVRGERKAVSQARDFKSNLARARKTSVNPKNIVRGNTTANKSTPHFISLTGSDRNKLEFPVKINRKNKVIREKLRMKFLEAVKKYFGVPYKQNWYTPKDTEYYYPMYVDCCGLTRRACIDLEAELGFEIGWWNQGYQVDTLPIVLQEDQMRPGDLIFYSAKLYNKEAKVHAHEMVHVEVFVGGETGKQSIGARRKGGVVQLFDTFRFESNRFYNTVYHFRSLETWLDGVCKSWCPDHEWRGTKKNSNYYVNIHRK